MNQLTKNSSESEIKAYFEGIAKLMQGNEQFPVNLEDVWSLVYATKSKAVQTLRRSELFIEGIDYQSLNQKVQREVGGTMRVEYMLSVPCLEFFIARKVRPVFEVYRKVFHKVVDTVRASTVPDPAPLSFIDTITPLSEFNRGIMARFKRLQEMTGGCPSVTQAWNGYYREYDMLRCNVCDLVFLEGVAQCDGIEYLKALRYTDGDHSIPIPMPKI